MKKKFIIVSILLSLFTGMWLGILFNEIYSTSSSLDNGIYKIKYKTNGQVIIKTHEEYVKELPCRGVVIKNIER